MTGGTHGSATQGGGRERLARLGGPAGPEGLLGRKLRWVCASAAGWAEALGWAAAACWAGKGDGLNRKGRSRGFWEFRDFRKRLQTNRIQI
jgi:hypothetical protein